MTTVSLIFRYFLIFKKLTNLCNVALVNERGGKVARLTRFECATPPLALFRRHVDCVARFEANNNYEKLKSKFLTLYVTLNRTPVAPRNHTQPSLPRPVVVLVQLASLAPMWVLGPVWTLLPRLADQMAGCKWRQCTVSKFVYVSVMKKIIK